MTHEKKFIERIEIEGEELVLDGKPYFKSPNTMRATREINVVGVLEEPRGRSEIHIGTGGCCFGYLTNILQGRPEEIDFITPIDFNIYDLMPVIFQRPANRKDIDEIAVNHILTTGYGCHGAGVRLTSLHSAYTKEIVSGKEFHPYIRPSHMTIYPRFRTQNERIYLDFLNGYHVSGQFVPNQTKKSIDLTSRLRDLEFDLTSENLWKIDIGATIEAIGNYQIKRSFD